MQEHLRAFLTPKHFSSSFELAGHIYEVELATPDLSGLEASVWADWGPMYTFELGEPGGVRVAYRCAARSTLGEYEIGDTKIKLNTPMSWSQRQRTPFYLGLADLPRALQFVGYLDGSGEPAGLEVKTLRPEAEIASLLFRSPPRRRSWGSAAPNLRVA